MADDTLIKIKRSPVPGKKPTTGQLELGELALNTNDGKLFVKRFKEFYDADLDEDITIEDIITFSGEVPIENTIFVQKVQ